MQPYKIVFTIIIYKHCYGPCSLKNIFIFILICFTNLDLLLILKDQEAKIDPGTYN